jgi:hypothetical protein
MEHVGGSLPDVTVCVEGEISGRGEDLFILLLQFLKPQKRSHHLLCTSLQDWRKGQITALM